MKISKRSGIIYDTEANTRHWNSAGLVSLAKVVALNPSVLVKIRARQMRFVGHIMRRGKIEGLSLTGRIPPGCRARERQRDKYMDGIIRTVGDGSKAVQILQMTRDREMWQSMVANVYRGTALRYWDTFLPLLCITLNQGMQKTAVCLLLVLMHNDFNHHCLLLLT